MLRLFYAPNTCALASHIALEESGADYEVRRLDFSRDEQRTPEYLQVNSKARVPALATERGVLTETPAILAFVAQSFPRAALAPLDDAFAFARVQAFNCYLCATVHVAHAHRVRGSRWADNDDAIAAMQRKVAANMADCFGLIERDLFSGPWVTGDSYSICDPYLSTLSGWLAGDGVDLARFPRIAEHRARMLARPAVGRVLASQ